jgi:hypothetical protein
MSKRKVPSPCQEANPDHPIVQPLVATFVMDNSFGIKKQMSLIFVFDLNIPVWKNLGFSSGE